ncbi:MAG: class I adenylate-forming enzyme family protein, partial [Myxococcota bacterium]
ALFSGYVPEDAPPFDDDGWFRTGDLGRFDAQGHLLVEGRARDLVITGGENVAPGRVEAVLRGLAEVEEVVVMGLPDREWGEVVAAVLVAPAADPCVLAPKRLRNRLEGRLAGFERPRRVFLASSLPLLPNGKIDRGEIRRRAQGSGFAELSDDLA